jgi:hypothetical protein
MRTRRKKDGLVRSIATLFVAFASALAIHSIHGPVYPINLQGRRSLRKTWPTRPRCRRPSATFDAYTGNGASDSGITVAAFANIVIATGTGLYVALAEREGIELVTADDKLIKNLQATFPFIVSLASL